MPHHPLFGQAASTDLLAKVRAEGYTFEVLAKPINPDMLLEKLNSPESSSGS